MDYIPKMNKMLLENVHESLSPPCMGQTYLMSGSYKYYHYVCDLFDDRGWGCGYRTLQTICSYICEQTNQKLNKVPTLLNIQEILVKLEDKPQKFIGSRDWVGSVEVCLVLDELFNVSSKILHIPKEKNLNQFINEIKYHFVHFGSPIMMGGDQDCSSKAVMGVHITENENFLLIVDPHFTGKAKDKWELQISGWVYWKSMNEFNDSSFYNLCLPQIKSKK